MVKNESMALLQALAFYNLQTRPIDLIFILLFIYLIHPDN